MSATRVILSLVMALALLAGCGKRGPLYLPGEKNPDEQPAPQQESQPESQEQNLPPPSTPGY